MKKYLSSASLFSLLVLMGLVTLSPVVSSAAGVAAGVSVGASAWSNGQGENGQGNDNGNGNRGMSPRGAGLGNMMKPGIFGVVSAVSGNTVTVNGKTGFGVGGPIGNQISGPNRVVQATTTYSVDATNAKVTKNNVASTVSAIAVGDTVMVQGTITGTNVVATMIRDGIVPGRGMMSKPEGNDNGQRGTTTSPIITGNGQPVVAGNVTIVNGSTITITNKSNVTYTIDATNAKIYQGNNTVVVLSSVAVGDSVVVQGTINGTSIVASTIIDQKVHVTTNGGSSGDNKPNPGFFGGIGNFFAHMFGF